MQSVALRFLIVAFCVISAVGFAEVRGAGVITDPALPLLNVPFCATPPSDISGDSLFVSSASDCSNTIATAGDGCPAAGSHAFSVSSASLQVSLTKPVFSVPPTYWCISNSGGIATSIGMLQMNVVQTIPMYYSKTKLAAMTFNEATPLGSIIRFYYADGTCRAPVVGYAQFILDENRTVEVSISVSEVGVCAIISSPVKGDTTSEMTLRNTLFSVPALTITPTTGVRFSNVAVKTNSSNIYYCALSDSKTCDDLPYPVYPQNNRNGTLILKVTKPAGNYYFCVAEGKKLYFPATSMFSVVEYGVQPNTAYTQWSTKIYPSINATSDMQVALFSSKDCSGIPVKDWATFTDASWSVSDAGTYYACVRASSSTMSDGYYFANAYTVVPLPTLTARQSVVVREFNLSLSFSVSTAEMPLAAIFVALSVNAACASFYRRAKALNGETLSFGIGPDAADTLYWCVSNPIVAGTADNEGTLVVSYGYVGSTSVRDFQVSYDPLRTNSPSTIVLDKMAALSSGMQVAFVPSARYTCADVSGKANGAVVVATVSASNTLESVTFPAAGQWRLCAQLNGSGTALTNLQSVSVYGDASVSPRGLIPKMTTALKLSALQPLQPVFITDAAACSNDSSALAAGEADSSGAASFILTYNDTGTLLVCGKYTGVEDGTIASTVKTMKAATVVSANPHIYPTVAELSAGKQELRLVGGGAHMLVGRRLVLTTKSTACPSSLTLPPFALVLSPLRLGSNAETPATTLTLHDNMMDTQFHACIKTNDTYVDVGTITVTRASLKTPVTSSPNPIALVAGQPSLLTLPSNYTSVALVDSYVVVDADADCTNDLGSTTVYTSGSINPNTGEASAFIAPSPASDSTTATVDLRLCVAQQSQLLNSTYGYLDGGALVSSTFTAVSKYALSDLNGGVTGWPVLSYASLYLVSCSGSSCDASAASATCRTASPQYTVSEATNTTLKPSMGTYLLCQRVTDGATTTVVGSNSTVQVLNAFTMSTTADRNQLRAFVGFDAVVTGGNALVVDVVVQPLAVPCGTSAATSQSFRFTTNQQRSIAITALTAYTPIHFCAKPSGQHADAFEVMTATLNSFVSPTYIAFPSLSSTSTISIPQPSMTSLQAMLARGPDCGSSVVGGRLTNAVGGTFTFTVSPCGENSNLDVVHFCDLSSGAKVYRGPLLMLRNGNCSANDGSASVRAVTVAPGAPITDFGVNTHFLAVLGISKTASCRTLIAAASVAAQGYVPIADESAVFYVCTYVITNPSVTFTTQQATLTVRNYVAVPSTARSPLSIISSGPARVLVTLNTALPSGYTFFSNGTGCLASISDAPGLNTSAASAVYSQASLCGTVSVCWQSAPDSAPLAVAQFASVTGPVLQSSTLAIVRGASYTATFARDSCSSATTFSNAKLAFLSADQCATRLDGTGAGVDALVFTTSVTSDLVTGLSTASLCANSTAGIVTVLAGVPVARDRVYPVVFTSGVAEAKIFIPSFARAFFWLTSADTSCRATSAQTTSLPSFTTDANGYGLLTVVSANGMPLPVGTYALCYYSSGFAMALESIEVVAPTFFDVRGTSFVTGVASKMLMQDDLQASDLIEGFSTTSNCSTLSTSYGTWARVSATSINVTATRAATGGAYLCARLPLNLSVAALPNAWSNTAQSLTFAPSTLHLPSTGFDVCTRYTLTQCTPPSGGGDDATNRLTVVYGDCCNSSDEANAVGVGSMAGGACSLSFDEAKVRGYPAGTVFSLCAWNSFDATVCATLNYVTVNTNCARDVTEKRSGLSLGAVVGVVVACVCGGLALMAGLLYLLCYFRRRAMEEDKASESGNVTDSTEITFYNGEEVCSTEWADLNLPPEDNNCGRARRLNVSSSITAMRRAVLAQVARSGGRWNGSSDDENDAPSLDSWREPLDTNFLDGCEELAEKYKDFINGVRRDDSESVADFPIAAFMKRSKLDTEALVALRKVCTQSAAVSDLLRPSVMTLQRHELLASMERTNPAAKTLYLFFEEQNIARIAIEISEETDFFNLRALFRSYNVMLHAQQSPPSKSQPTPADGGGNGECVFLMENVPNARGRVVEPFASPHWSVALPSADATPAQTRERQWLYRHRSELEFPWVTNNFRTLVGYRKGNGERYNYMDWSLTLLDLQAFHPLHRWWSPLLPCVSPSPVDACDARFAFMHANSTVPFVKRYLMLFKVEYLERTQIETEEVIDISAIQSGIIDFADRCVPRNQAGMTDSAAAMAGNARYAAAEAANPLMRSRVVMHDRFTSATRGVRPRRGAAADDDSSTGECSVFRPDGDHSSAPNASFFAANM
ncbi:hypothetical protein N2W54_006913 [Lotmaria passim]